MKVVASPEEHALITTNPQETLDRQRAFADKLLKENQRAYCTCCPTPRPQWNPPQQLCRPLQMTRLQ